MKERVLITGISGGLAKETKNILSENYEVFGLTHNKNNIDNKNTFFWNPSTQEIDKKALDKCDHIVHLSGYSILKKWTRRNKKIMYNSRIGGAELLFKTCNELNIKPKTFITASAIGIYGLNSEGEKKEDNSLGNDWIAKMAIDWENAANMFNKLESRVVHMRISLLISEKTGILKYNLLSMKLGIGAIIGSNNGIVNWIHIHDVARFIKSSIKEKSFKGPYNLATNEKITQYNFIRTIKNNLYSYSLIINIPSIVLKVILGDRFQIIKLGNTTINIDKLKKNNFNWKYKTFKSVIKNIKN